MRAAAVQMKVTRNPEKNLNRMFRFFEKAKRKRADIACFPETCLVSDHENIIESSAYVKKVQEACRKSGVWCIFGTYEKKKGKNYNVAYVIDRNGKIKYRYVKRHPWRTELKYLVPGKTNNVINTEFGKIGVIICWDFAFGDELKKLSQGGARVIFCPSFLVDSSGAKDVVKSTPQFRAFENMCYYVTADAFHRKTACKSFICSPLRMMKRIEGKEGMIVFDLDLKKIDKLRRNFDHV